MHYSQTLTHHCSDWSTSFFSNQTVQIYRMLWHCNTITLAMKWQKMRALAAQPQLTWCRQETGLPFLYPSFLHLGASPLRQHASMQLQSQCVPVHSFPHLSLSLSACTEQKKRGEMRVKRNAPCRPVKSGAFCILAPMYVCTSSSAAAEPWPAAFGGESGSGSMDGGINERAPWVSLAAGSPSARLRNCKVALVLHCISVLVASSNFFLLLLWASMVGLLWWQRHCCTNFCLLYMDPCKSESISWGMVSHFYACKVVPVRFSLNNFEEEKKHGARQ